MAGVELTAPGANPFTTGNDGQFVLTFPQGHPGQDVTVRVSRASWEVVNDVLLDRQLPEPASAHRFEVILCASGEREQRRTEFYRLKGNQAVEQTYRAKLAELEGRHAATVQERDRLLRERDDALKQVDEWARQAAARKPDEVGGTYKEAFRLFVDGKTDAALQRLSDERLQQEVDQAQAQLQQALAGWLLKGQLLTTKFDYEGAARAYDKAVAAAPDSAEAWQAYAYFQARTSPPPPAMAMASWKQRSTPLRRPTALRAQRRPMAPWGPRDERRLRATRSRAGGRGERAHGVRRAAPGCEAGTTRVSKTAAIWRTKAAPNASFSQRKIGSRWSGRRWSITAAASGVRACLDAPPIGIASGAAWPPAGL
jgi:hypothetical protein